MISFVNVYGKVTIKLLVTYSSLKSVYLCAIFYSLLLAHISFTSIALCNVKLQNCKSSNRPPGAFQRRQKGAICPACNKEGGTKHEKKIVERARGYPKLNRGKYLYTSVINSYLIIAVDATIIA